MGAEGELYGGRGGRKVRQMRSTMQNTGRSAFSLERQLRILPVQSPPLQAALPHLEVQLALCDGPGE